MGLHYHVFAYILITAFCRLHYPTGLHYNVFAYILITAFCRLHYPTGLHYNVFKITPFHGLHVCQLSAFSRPMQFNHNLSINVSLSPPCPTMHVQALGSPFS